mmetsp:Transcript_60327/g.73916  ORF Transcript_60327/g.73916 Transcript_60327/m.73916 type:complete len:137 (-) Transcript_60327:23-433(-)
MMSKIHHANAFRKFNIIPHRYELNLHDGFTVNASIYAIYIFLDKLINQYNNNKMDKNAEFRIITGKGLHSEDMIPILKPKLLSYINNVIGINCDVIEEEKGILHLYRESMIQWIKNQNKLNQEPIKDASLQLNLIV